MEAAADEKQKARTACVELTKRFMEEKATFEDSVRTQADALVEQV